MVFTRNQKRNFEYEDEDVVLESGVNLDISRKRLKQHIETDEDEESVRSEDVASCNDTSNTADLDTENTVESTTRATSTSHNYGLHTGLRNVVAQIVNTCLPKAKKRDEPLVETEYDKFTQYIDDIQNGMFFERVPLEDDQDKVRAMYSEEQIKEFNSELHKLRDTYRNTAPSIMDILKLQIPNSHKNRLLEKVYNYANADLLTSEYKSSLKYLLENINKTEEPELFALEQEIIKCAQSEEVSDNYRRKILKSKMSFENKVIAYKRLEEMEQYEDTDNSEFSKYKNWMDKLLRVPYGKHVLSPCINSNTSEEIQSYLHNIRAVLDKRLSFLEKPKDQIINIVSQIVRNPDISINAIGLYGCAGLGKCLAKNTPVLMFDGSIKMVQNITVGDVLMGDDSSPRNVLSLARGREEMYEILHNNTMESYTVNKSHILSLKVSGCKSMRFRSTRRSWEVKWFDIEKRRFTSKHFKDNIAANKLYNSISDDMILDISVKEYLQLPDFVKKQLKGYKTGVSFTARKIQFDPYILGVWLGDGTSSKPQITNQDASILHYVASVLPKYNCYLSYSKSLYTYNILGCEKRKGGSNIFWNILKSYDMVNNKHIPNDYLINTRDVRMKILAGLIDSDGYCFENCFELSQKSEKLANDIRFLCSSLGFAVKMRKVKKGCTYKGEYKEGNYYKLSIYGKGLEEIPILCTRKRAHVRRQVKDALRTSFQVLPKGIDKYYGFEIDGNKRFVLGNFIVTHNTSVASSIAEALGRPFRTISLGGESDSSMLLGHNFTYVGSGPGRLIDILNETQCMNPVILLDELDKVSETHHGKEIIGSLIHLTDSSTNSKYNYDRYFSGIEFDLSKVLFIFTYNDPDKLDRILSDRLFKIKLENYTTREKLEIANKHLIPNTLSSYNFSNEQIVFEKNAVEYIINGSKDDQGMRGIKRKFEIITSRVNTLMLTNENENIVKLKYKSLYPHYSMPLPVTVLKEHVDILLSESTSNPDEDMGPPPSMYI